MSRRTRQQRREERRKAAEAAAAAPKAANGCESAHEKPWRPPASLTPKRLRFAVLWAEADPEDSLQSIARAAGYSESSAASGLVADLCRDPAVQEVRDHRLAELQQASRVTVEATLVGLQVIARDPTAPPRDRVAALKTILAWYSSTKGSHKPEEKKASAGLGEELARALALQLGIPAEVPEP